MAEPPPPVTVLGRLSFEALVVALLGAAAADPWSLVDAARPLAALLPTAPDDDDDVASLSFNCWA